jgi:hypothetical protein
VEKCLYEHSSIAANIDGLIELHCGALVPMKYQKNQEKLISS